MSIVTWCGKSCTPNFCAQPEASCGEQGAGHPLDTHPCLFCLGGSLPSSSASVPNSLIDWGGGDERDLHGREIVMHFIFSQIFLVHT